MMHLPHFLLQRLLWLLPVCLMPLTSFGQQLAIDSVTVQPQTGYVEIYWSWEGDVPAGATFKVHRKAQVIYTVIEEGLSSETRSFVDETSDASKRQERYYVTALDDKGVTLASSEIHGTIFLKIEGLDICAREVFIQWENYSVFDNEGNFEDPLPVPFDKVEILTSVNGFFAKAGELDFGPQEFRLQDVEPGNYSIIIRAHGPGVSSSSNVLEVDVSTLALPKFPPYIRSVDIVDDRLVQLRLHVDNTVVSPSFVIHRSENASGGFVPIDTIAADQQDIIYEDPIADPHARQWFYQVEMLDSCGMVTEDSQTASTLFLQARQQDIHTTVLEWEHQPEWGGGIQHYDILRKLPGQDQFFQVNLTGAVNRYEDNLRAIADEMRSGMIHYQVAGHEGIGNKFKIQASVVSNIVAVTSEETIFVPNAFRPLSSKAQNQVFKPAMVAVSDEGYQLLVFNRWGEQIFMSAVPDEGWDGTAGGEQSPAGVYAWVLKYKDGSGQEKEKRGVVTLIR